MTRYTVLVNVRPEGSLDVFDPYILTVNAIDPQAAMAVAAAVAHDNGWDFNGGSIVSAQPMKGN